MFKEQNKSKIMTIKRIVSFLPSATELLYEFGVQDKLYGVTHECRYPKDAMNKPQIISSAIDSEKLSSKEIDTKTCQLLKNGKEIFILNEKNLRKADPDLIISQETCEVCAVYTNQINKAIQILEKKPIIHSMDPHSIKEILDSVITLGTILKKQSKAKEITKTLKKKIQNIKKIDNKEKPRILAIEWIDPFFSAGHWIPEMIEIAGGQNLISQPREHSRRLKFQEIVNSEPDVIIIMSCGFDTNRIVSEYNKTLKENEDWNQLEAVKTKKVFAVNANSFFSKPSIRTIEGLEILAKIIQPEEFSKLRVAKESFLNIK